MRYHVIGVLVVITMAFAPGVEWRVRHAAKYVPDCAIPVHRLPLKRYVFMVALSLAGKMDGHGPRVVACVMMRVREGEGW